MRIIEVTFEKEYPPKLIGRPPNWENDQPLFIDEDAELPVELFPLIEDFEVVLENFDNARWGYHINFFSEKRGYLAGFMLWDYAEKMLCEDNFKIPFLYEDLDQGWELMIEEQDGLVYVCEKDFDHPEKGILSWFKVEKERYIAEWQLAIAAAKQICKDVHYLWESDARSIKRKEIKSVDKDVLKGLQQNFFEETMKQMDRDSIFAEAQVGVRYKCPCCDYKTLESRGGYDICPVCFWEDDGQDDADANTNRFFGPNHISLTLARKNYRQFGACEKRVLKYVRPPLPEEQ